MCTLAIYFQASDEYPLVVVANRDEFFDRPTVAPHVLSEKPWVVGGRDLRAEGTWLGMNEHAIVAGLLNRRTEQPPDPTKRSRGLLCVETLRFQTPAQAGESVLSQRGGRYNPFNLLIASPAEAYVVGNFTGVMRSIPLTPGLHLLSNLELDDFECPRIAKSFGLFAGAAELLCSTRIDEFLVTTKGILADHSTPLDPRSSGPPNNLCVHLPGYGTRSSSIVIFEEPRRRARLWYADGPPCSSTYAEVTLPSMSLR